MDIKQKLKSFITRQENLPSPGEEHISPDTFSGEAAVAKLKHQHQQPNNPQEEQEIIDSIEKVYYHDEKEDVSGVLLQNVPDTLNLEEISGDRTKLRRQLEAVSRRVSELILQNHPAYAAELQRVMELQRTLQLAGVICANGRSQLQRSRESFTVASLGLLANCKKQQQLLGLLKSLRTIKTLQRTDLRLREMMDEEDYCGAIQLCLECQKAASTFRHYKCISELSSKLQDTLEMIEEQLDGALSKTCSGFDQEHYTKVQTAYRLLGKTQTAMDQLHMHFTSAIHNTAFTIVLGYAELCSGTGSTNFQKRQYPDLCKHVTLESFTPCLVGLCRALWEVMKSYYRTMQWHLTHDQDGATTVEENADAGATVEATFNRRYVMQKLENGRVRVWQDVQQKVKTFVLSSDLSEFKLEEFIEVLDIINRMIEIGEEFCGSKSEGLQDSLKQQSLNYFKNHHRTRMDELRMFLENEGWEMCPVKSNFNILQLTEFKFLRGRMGSLHVGANSGLEPGSEATSNPGAPASGYFERYVQEGSPFDKQQEEEEKEDVLDSDQVKAEDGYGDSDSDSDIPEELKNDYIDELTGETRSHLRPSRRRASKSRNSLKVVPIITNTTLNVLRVIGKYLQMMTVLKPVAFDVIQCLSQLFDYYLYTVYLCFGSERPLSEDKTVSNRLSITVQRIKDNLITGSLSGDKEESRDKVPPTHLSPVVDLQNSSQLYGLPERVVASESLVFLANQFELLEPFLSSMNPPNKKAFLQSFYSQTVKMAAELRKPVYREVAARALDYDSALQQMSNVRWDVKEIMSQHNPYIDSLLKSYQEFQRKLGEVERRVPIPAVVHNLLWEHCIRLSCRTFVEGYANARKCSNEGRALMQLDFQQFLTKVEKMVTLRPIPEREFVEAYIKAYYLPEAQLDSWIQDHKEYSNKQMLTLIQTIPHISKKARQRLSTVIEEMDRRR